MDEARDKNGLTEAEFLQAYNPGKYPRPSLTADVCVFASGGAALDVLLVKRGGHPYLGSWALPGGFANGNESLEQTAQRELAEETGIGHVEAELVGVYSAPGRDPRGWVVSAAYAGMVNRADIAVHAADDAADARWFTVCADDAAAFGGSGITLRSGDIAIPLFGGEASDNALAFDHAQIIADALRRVCPAAGLCVENATCVPVRNG